MSTVAYDFIVLPRSTRPVPKRSVRAIAVAVVRDLRAQDGPLEFDCRGRGAPRPLNNQPKDPVGAIRRWAVSTNPIARAAIAILGETEAARVYCRMPQIGGSRSKSEDTMLITAAAKAAGRQPATPKNAAAATFTARPVLRLVTKGGA